MTIKIHVNQHVTAISLTASFGAEEGTMDLEFHDHGSIWLLTPVTTAGADWVNEHIPDDSMTFGGSIAVEPRYVLAIVQGIRDAGLEVSHA